jgi:hypothetical protein
MIPKKPAPDSIRGGNRFSINIMLKPTIQTAVQSFELDHGPARDPIARSGAVDQISP